MTTKKVVLTLGGKGGTGKTLFCRTLFHLLKGEGIYTLGFDGDRENPEFWDYHKNESNPVLRLDFLNIDDARQFISQLEESQPQVALFDMPGASGAATREQFARFNLFHTLKDELDGYEVTVVAVMNDCFNAIGSLKMMMEAFDEQAKYVAVLSDFWAKGKTPFQRWKGCERRKHFLQLGGKEVSMPMLELEVFDTLHGKASPFSRLNGLPLGDRVLLRSYLTRARAEFDLAHDYLGLPPLDGRDTNELVTQGINTISAQQQESAKQPAKAN
ncbi:MAG: hypothetical protein HC824_21810 [Synechococcales cyanobacterium RM1_1_8]|nr:hypothetical protein [Synechococcales cyanobacterium RM1_1_8]